MTCLHDFETKGEDNSVIVEVCKICKITKRYNKDHAGRINNQEYLSDHVRDFAQPGGRTGKIYEQLYGKPKDIKTKGTNKNR